MYAVYFRMPWHCSICIALMCPDLKELLRHMRVQHQNEFPLICGVTGCQRNCLTHRALYHHCSTHHIPSWMGEENRSGSRVFHPVPFVVPDRDAEAFVPLPPQLNEVELEAEYNPESSNDNTDSDNDSDNDSDIENRESSDDEDVLIEDANGFNIDVRSRVAVGMTQMRRKFRLTQVSNHVIYLGIVVMELFFFRDGGHLYGFFFIT